MVAVGDPRKKTYGPRMNTMNTDKAYVLVLSVFIGVHLWPNVSFFYSRVSSKPRSGMLQWRVSDACPCSAEDLAHQIADAFVAALVEYQDGGTGAAQRAAEQSRRAQAQDLVQARHQRLPVRLVEAVFERRRKDGRRTGGQRRHQQGGALHVEDGVLAAVARGQDGARLGGRAGRNPEPRWPGRNACGRSRRTARVTPPESIALATIEPSTHGATLSGWPSRRAASSRMRSGFQPRFEQFVGDHDAGGERRGARSHALAERDFVVDVAARWAASACATAPPRRAPSARSGCRHVRRCMRHRGPRR